MAEKLPVIIDNRGDNTVVNAIRRQPANVNVLVGGERTRRTRPETIQGRGRHPTTVLRERKRRAEVLGKLPTVCGTGVPV
jgi:hypothetical protein